jgi:phosphate-selective porin OprO and OprP
MRKLKFICAATLMLSVVPSAFAGAGAVSYDEGTMISFPDDGVNVKLNVQVQPGFEYRDSDEEGVDNVNEFDVRRGRLDMTGDAADGQVSFRLQNGFTSTDGENEDLLDAWLEWNESEYVNVRMGQFKIPNSLQFWADSWNLQMVNRSIVTDAFAIGRDEGAMFHGAVADGVYHYASVSNGESDGEGRNGDAADTDLLGSYNIHVVGGGYDRRSEGDVAMSSEMQWTAGAGVNYGQSTQSDVEIDTTGVNFDAGMRQDGMSLQAEFQYLNLNPDGVEEVDNIGYYVQAGYFVQPETWEVAARFAAINPDSSLEEDDTFEYGIGLNRYISGHNLKLQTGVTWIDTGDADADQFRYDLLATAYL